jgi:hypothetical protein
LHAESFGLLVSSVMPRAQKGAGSSQRTVVQKRFASRTATLAEAKDGTADRPVNLVGTTDLLMSTHASVLVDSVGPPSVEVCRAAASFP